MAWAVGGGGFMLYYHAATEELVAFDGRETAPMQAWGGYLHEVSPGSNEPQTPWRPLRPWPSLALQLCFCQRLAASWTWGFTLVRFAAASALQEHNYVAKVGQAAKDAKGSGGWVSSVGPGRHRQLEGLLHRVRSDRSERLLEVVVAAFP